MLFRYAFLVSSVLELLASGETPDDIIANAYPKLTKRHIDVALDYAARLTQEGRLLVDSRRLYATSR